ncbi:MAG TPA: SPFH domain-containing protein [Rhizomicrobium sp.]|nr:SPFH domain-containing protein [Rhizomicrobium sp.]
MSRQNEQQAAARPPQPELWTGLVFLALGAGLLAASLLLRRLPPAPVRLFLELSAILLVAAASFLAAFLTARARRRGVLPRRSPRHPGKALPPVLEKLRGAAHSARRVVTRIDWIGDWSAIAVTVLLGLAALFALRKAWLMLASPSGPLFDELTAGILLAACFPLLVLERRYAGLPEEVLPEAPLLDRIIRLPLLGFLGLALAAGLRWLGLRTASWVEHAIVIVTALVAAELVLRSLAYLLLPLPPLASRRSHADSFIAGLIRPQLPNFTALNASVRREFGIDLARSWALGFIRRAFVPLLLGMVVFSWLLTGVTALGLDQRAVYEAFGTPEGVMHSGLHLHWPWPFGVLRPVEYGEVREIPIEYRNSGLPQAEGAPQASAADIEGEAPPAADRLWDSSHPEEASYLVAAMSEGQQSFEAVDIDLSIVYRIGLSDQAAEQAVYRLAAPAAIISSAASQMLARYFAHSTIEEVLGQNHVTFVHDFQKALQARMNALGTGLDIMAIVVEGIHPPPQAAIAYQGVQAAAIESVVRVATARAESAREMKMAALVANSTSNDATAAAEERIDQAQRDFTLFDGDRQAYAAGGAAFLFERRLDRLQKGLADKPLIIVDHRIKRPEGPTVNLVSPRVGVTGSGLVPSDD